MRRVVRVSSRTPRWFSRSVTWREMSARDRPRVLAASEKLPSLMTSTKLCMVRKRSMAPSISQPSATLLLTFALFSGQIRKRNVSFRRLHIHAKGRARQRIRPLVKRKIQGLLIDEAGLFTMKQPIGRQVLPGQWQWPCALRWPSDGRLERNEGQTRRANQSPHKSLWLRGPVPSSLQELTIQWCLASLLSQNE